MFNPQLKPTARKKKPGIAKYTPAQQALHAKMIAAYKKIDVKRGELCEGCEMSKAHEHSHTISQKRCKDLNKIELIYDPQNIELMCRNCHNIWEIGTVAEKQQLLNFKRMLEMLKLHDRQRFQIMSIEIALRQGK
jgi:hypothetical protein